MGTQENNNSPLHDLREVANSQEESTIFEQTPNGDTGEKPSPYGLSLQARETSEDSNAKRSNPNKGEGNENDQVKVEEESKECNNRNANDEKQSKSNSKPPEPPKDYIHVRATRGQATDSHSLAERGTTTLKRETPWLAWWHEETRRRTHDIVLRPSAEVTGVRQCRQTTEITMR
ncbi:hypothetical protein JHK87_027861 [Glycine soja]|nr:hypothetical protein JHK87_027861 [Glycine soja]